MSHTNFCSSFESFVSNLFDFFLDFVSEIKKCNFCKSKNYLGKIKNKLTNPQPESPSDIDNGEPISRLLEIFLVVLEFFLESNHTWWI